MTQRDEGHDFRDSKNKAQAHERKQAEKEKLLKEFDIDDESEYPYIKVLGQIYKNNIPTMNQYLQQEDC